VAAGDYTPHASTIGYRLIKRPFHLEPNLTNRTNYVFESFDGHNNRTGQAFLTLTKMFPILPSAGVVFEK
jgi:hypothetical protein